MKLLYSLLFTFLTVISLNADSSSCIPEGYIKGDLHSSEIPSGQTCGSSADIYTCDFDNWRETRTFQTGGVEDLSQCAEGYLLYETNYEIYNWIEIPPCEPEPTPEGKISLVHGLWFDECNDLKNLRTYEFGGNSYNNLSCWADSCGDLDSDVYILFGVVKPDPICTNDEIMNSAGDCVPISDSLPDDISSSEDGLGSSLAAIEDCITGQVIEQSSTSIVKVIGWDYEDSKCKVKAFVCNQGRVLDLANMACIIPPENSSFGSDECPYDDWAKRYSHDFCGECTGTVSFWLPPVGLEGYGLECNKRYLEYQCVKDYRLKQFVEVSCGDPIPTDEETHEMIIDGEDNTFIDDDSSLIDQNTSNLATIDPTSSNLAIIEGLSKIESAINNNLKPVLNSQNNKLGSINGKLSTTNSKLGSIDGKLSDIDGKLGDIKGVLEGDESGSINGDTFSINGVDLSGDLDSGIYDNLEDTFSDMTSGLTSIKSDFDNTKALLTGNTPVVTIPSGSCSNEHLTKFGTYIAPYSSIFALITYISLMISIFKMIFSYMARGE